MIVDDLDVEGITVLPNEAHSELLVDPNRVLTRPISSERLQVVARSEIR
jgi:hypothetical protein